MSKFVSLILVLVLFFGSSFNSFAKEKTEDEKRSEKASAVVGGIVLIGCLILWIGPAWSKHVMVEAPDDGIRMVSSENETSTTKTSDKTILNVLQHVEAGVMPNKDIYVGLRFQY